MTRERSGMPLRSFLPTGAVHASPRVLAHAQEQTLGPSVGEPVARSLLQQLSRLRFTSFHISFLVPILSFLAVASYFVVRSHFIVVPEGDSALHLQLMKVVANGHLPQSVPYFAAAVEEGGEVAAFFPYSYTPLYHLLGGAVYKVGGEPAVLMMGPVFSGVIAAAIAYLLRPQPATVVALALPLVFLHWLTQPTLTWVFMEPMMLAFFFVGLCFYRGVWSTASKRDAMLAGICFGLAIATRQSALIYAGLVAVHAALTLAVDMRGGRPRAEALRHIRSYALMGAVATIVAAPALAYLFWTTGTIGYGQLTLPGVPGTLPVDPVANEYLSSFSTPPGDALDWLNRYWEWMLFTPRWQIRAIAFLPLVPYIVGTAHLWSRPDRSGKFLASFTAVILLGEMVQFMLFHGSWRYIIASRLLFYTVVAVGIWTIVRWMYQSARAGDSRNPRFAGACAAALSVAALLPGFVTPGLVGFLAQQGENRAEKAESFEELGAFVSEHVPEDALILSGRWYTTGWYLERNYAWVSYFGNAWVIDAIGTRSASNSRSFLERYGVDYVVIQAPPPTYVDSMPSWGLRNVVLTDLEHFQLIFSNERTRLYKFWPEGMSDGAVLKELSESHGSQRR
jgi:hypothetical protein